MIVVRFKGRFRPEATEQAVAACRRIITASRPLEGLISFDIGRDLSDPDSVIAIEVWETREALERQESLPEVREANAVLDDLLNEPAEFTIYRVSA